jgi:hypothetical protein
MSASNDSSVEEKIDKNKLEMELVTKHGDKIAGYSKDISHELVRAMTKFKPFNNYHEAYAKLLEEVDEFWDAVKADDLPHARKEIIQVAAMALRTLVELEGVTVDDSKN